MVEESQWHENYDLGKAEFFESNYTVAQIHLLQVVEAGPKFADVFNMLGLIYCHQNEYKDAVSMFKKAIDINPNYTESYLNLAVCYNDIGEMDKSQEMYAKARETSSQGPTSYIDPNVGGKLANMHASLGDIYKDFAMYDEALQEYGKALNLRDEFVDIQLKVALVYRDLKDFDRTLKELEAAKAKRPNFVEAFIHIGLTYFMMDEKEKAKQEWLNALKINPKNTLANMYLKMV